MISLLLGVLVVVLVVSMSQLAGRVATLEERLTATGRLQDAIDALKQRVARLEAAPKAAAPAAAIVFAGVSAPTPAEAAPPPAASVDASIEDDMEDADKPGDVSLPAAFDEALALLIMGRADATSETMPEVEEAQPEAAPQPVSPEPAAGIAAAAAAPRHESPADSAEAWEVVVGTSWLNKIGVLIFVTGLTLLLGYSMTHVGPAGRVAMGLMIGVTMLLAGVAIERHPLYEAYGRGLIAGGWAGIYVTAYAMHAVPAAQVIESDLAAGLLLLVVAGGMVIHSLRYRSQTITALAYVAAYVPLGLSPLSTFSLVAACPLAASLLVVAVRFGWTGISLFGLASTYGLFVLRGQVLPGVAPDASTATPYLLLATYWLTFEIADITAQRAGHDHGTTAARPLFATNAIGYLGCLFLLLPADTPRLSAFVLAMSAAGYLTSAIVRARILGSASVPTEAPPMFTTTHAAVALAAALAAWSIGLRFEGPRMTVALLIEAELLVSCALTLADVNIRRIGTAAAALVTAQVVMAAGADPSATITWPWPMSEWTPALALVAASWYFNREWMRQRGVSIDSPERLYTWVASIIVGLILGHEVSPAFRGLAGMIAAMALLQAGTRRAAEYRYQAYAALALGVFSVVVRFAFAAPAPSSREIWTVLPLATLLAYAFAWWTNRQAGTVPDDERSAAAAFAGCAGTALLTVLEWRVVPEQWVGAVWTLTAAALVSVGAWRRLGGLRGQGYVLIALGATRGLVPLLLTTPHGWSATSAIVLVIGLLYLTSYVGRRAADAAADSTSDLERTIAGLLSFVATPALALLKWRILPDSAVAPAWAATAIVMVCLGRWRHRAGQRWQAYGLAALAILQALRDIDLGASGFGERLAPGTTALSTAAVFVFVYLVTYLGRGRDDQAASGGAPDLERLTLMLLPVLATFGVLDLEHAVFADVSVSLAWCLTASAILAAGFVSHATDIRAQAYVAFGLGAARTTASIWLLGPDADMVGVVAVIGLLYTTSLLSRMPLRRTALEAPAAAPFEETARIGLAAGATVMSTLLVGVQARTNLLTMSWGLQGATLLLVGFAARERALRLSGLALLFLCIIKLFVYDLRELEALGRIISFVALGLVLLGVSWTYTRYKEQIRKLL